MSTEQKPETNERQIENMWDLFHSMWDDSRAGRSYTKCNWTTLHSVIASALDAKDVALLAKDEQIAAKDFEIEAQSRQSRIRAEHPTFRAATVRGAT